jgi:hypothetical protein
MEVEMSIKIEANVHKYPYARLKGIKDFMTFLREPGWKPTKVSRELLIKLDIAKGKESEALHALKFLGIIDSDGAPTQIFDELKGNYKSTLKRIIEESYSDLFSILPPRMMNQSRLVKFFGTTTETAEYQAKLFVWLCGEAGIDLPNVEKHFHRARFDKKKEEVIS